MTFTEKTMINYSDIKQLLIMWTKDGAFINNYVDYMLFSLNFP